MKKTPGANAADREAYWIRTIEEANGIRPESQRSATTKASRNTTIILGSGGFGNPIAPEKRGPKVDAQAARIKELEKKTAKLEKQLQHANLLLDLQKKVAEILGTRLPESES